MTSGTDRVLLEQFASLPGKSIGIPFHQTGVSRDCLEPCVFRPVIRHALWGGQKLQRVLGKSTGGAVDAAESWEVCDLPGYQTRIAEGTHRGKTLSDLLTGFRKPLLGRHAHKACFPLLIKFLDARRPLSLQVHPCHPVCQVDGTIRPGKAEAWVVLQAAEKSRMTLGLREGVTEAELHQAIRDDRLEECLHFYSPQPGDCVFLPPGTVHALGDGLLVAEIQEPSDITYRLHDWGRKDHQGRFRELHLEQGLASTRFDLGPVVPMVPRPLEGHTGSEVLVASDHFVIHRHTGPQCWQFPEDDVMHILIVLSGELRRCSSNLTEQVYPQGTTVVVPASRPDDYWLFDKETILLDTFLPIVDRQDQ